jgi:curved DNA-binding protein CbpA
MKDYFEILGVSRNATAEEVRNAYYKLAKKYHPDHLDHYEIKLYLPRFLKITKAYLTLKDEKKRKEYLQALALGEFMEDQEKERKESREKVFDIGLDLLKRDSPRATKYFRTAYSLERNNQTYKSYYGLSLILSGREEKGLALCKEALEKEESALHHYNLAAGYVKTGNYRNAVNHLKKALRIDKNHTESKNLLEKIKGKAGIFRK